MATAQINGIDIHYVDTGGDGPAVLFSHGFLMNHTMFDQQVDALHSEYRCVTWDERGFGGTRTNGPFTYWDSADDAIGLLDHLGIESAVLVGMSQGGFLSLRAALNHPDRVRALVLIDSFASVDDPEVIESYAAMAHIFLHGTDDERADVFEIVSAMILGDDGLAAAWLPVWDGLDREQLDLATTTLLGRDDISDRIGEITCPILAIHGTADLAVDISAANALAAVASDHRGVVPIEGAAHAPNMTHPAPVNAAISEFLRSLDDSG